MGRHSAPTTDPMRPAAESAWPTTDSDRASSGPAWPTTGSPHPTAGSRWPRAEAGWPWAEADGPRSEPGWPRAEAAWEGGTPGASARRRHEHADHTQPIPLPQPTAATSAGRSGPLDRPAWSADHRAAAPGGPLPWSAEPARRSPDILQTLSAFGAPPPRPPDVSAPPPDSSGRRPEGFGASPERSGRFDRGRAIPTDLATFLGRDREIPEQRQPLLSSGPLAVVPPGVPAPSAASVEAVAAQPTTAPPTTAPPTTAPPTTAPLTTAPPTTAPPAGPAPDAPPWSPTFVGPTATPWSTLPQPAIRGLPLRRASRKPAAEPASDSGSDRGAAPPIEAAASAPAAPPTPAGQAPDQPTEPRLLAGWLATGRPTELEEHLRRYGPLPRARFAGRRGAAALLALVEQSGLRGRGGAGFPTARKMSAVAAAASSRRRPVVVANGCEGDPTSTKDRLLLHSAPHLVLDGLALAAHCVGADQAIVCLPRGSELVEPLEQAVAQRTEDPAQVHIVTTPHRFVASEASALVNFLTTGDARPTSSPPLPAERGVQGRPTLLDNVETLAHLALLARHDAAWFRARGTADSPGTMLFTVGGAVHRPGVYEVDMGAAASQLLGLAGGPTGPSSAALLGGLGGSWVPLSAGAELKLAHRDQGEHRPRGVPAPALGLASLLVLPPEGCGLAVTAAILEYLAGESAGQCGPCMFGLPSVAADFAALAVGQAEPELLERLRRRLGVIPGRGACAHPDGAVGLAASALSVFAADVARHAAGRPCGQAHAATLPILNRLSDPEQGWR